MATVRFTPIFRDHLEHKHSGRCHLCGELLDGAWHVDHICPRAHGGTDHPKNLAPAHARCNQVKGTRSVRAARRELGYYERSDDTGEFVAVGAVLGAWFDAEKPLRGALLGAAGLLLLKGMLK